MAAAIRDGGALILCKHATRILLRLSSKSSECRLAPTSRWVTLQLNSGLSVVLRPPMNDTYSVTSCIIVVETDDIACAWVSVVWWILLKIDAIVNTSPTRPIGSCRTRTSQLAVISN